MSGHRFFNKLRSGLAPLIRPVLEGVGPVRRLGLWVLSRRHPDEVELDGQTFKVDPRDFGVTLELHSTGTYEPFTRGLCLESLEPGMVFLDIHLDHVDRLHAGRFEPAVDRHDRRLDCLDS